MSIVGKYGEVFRDFRIWVVRRVKTIDVVNWESLAKKAKRPRIYVFVGFI